LRRASHANQARPVTFGGVQIDADDLRNPVDSIAQAIPGDRERQAI
jgi:hypothetical protein